MGTTRRGRSRFCGYRTPYSDEARSEREYFKHLLKLKSQEAEYLPIGRQIPVFVREKLDLLALDLNGVPTVFEFKRDLAGYESVSQLLTYGGYVARWSMSHLRSLYDRVDGRRDLDRAFRARFRKDLPAELPNQVNLVLAAFEFSLPCRHALQFLEESAGLVIGRLKVESVWDWDLPIPQAEYRWVRRPVPTRALEVGSEPIDPGPYYFLQEYFDEFPLHWISCINNNFIPVPASWNIKENPIAPGSGIFVYLAGMPTNYDHELNCGLVGYGVTTGEAFDILPEIRQYELHPEDFDRAPKDEFFVLPVDWVRVRPDNDPAPVSIYLPPSMHLTPIWDPLYIDSLKEDLAARPHAPVGEPPAEDGPGSSDEVLKEQS